MFFPLLIHCQSTFLPTIIEWLIVMCGSFSETKRVNVMPSAIEQGLFSGISWTVCKGELLDLGYS